MLRLTICFAVGLLLLRQATAQLLTYGRLGGNATLSKRIGSPPLTLSWAASGFQAQFRSSSVQVHIQAEREDEIKVYGHSSIFRFDLDGKTELQRTSEDQSDIRWQAKGLSNKTHNLQVTRLNQPKGGVARLLNISLSPSGRFSPPNPKAVTHRRIQFIGDSYTAGYADLGNSSCHGALENANPIVTPIFYEGDINAINEDVTASYGGLVADFFKADYQVLAWGGGALFPRAVANASNLTQIAGPVLPHQLPSIPQLFQQLVAGDDSSRQFNLSFWIPQIVVIAGGTNDVYGLIPPIENWAAQYITFIEQIQQVYDDPIILIISFPLEMQTNGILTPTQAATYLQYHAYLSTVLQELAFDKVHLVQITATHMPLKNWCAAHPNAAAHRVIGQQLASFIENVAPDWVNMVP